MSEWISVRERLPEFDKLVLTYNPSTKYESLRVLVSCLHSNYTEEPETGLPLFYSAILDLLGVGGYLHEVSHWQPLYEHPEVF